MAALSALSAPFQEVSDVDGIEDRCVIDQVVRQQPVKILQDASWQAADPDAQGPEDAGPAEPAIAVDRHDLSVRLVAAQGGKTRRHQEAERRELSDGIASVDEADGAHGKSLSKAGIADARCAIDVDTLDSGEARRCQDGQSSSQAVPGEPDLGAGLVPAHVSEAIVELIEDLVAIEGCEKSLMDPALRWPWSGNEGNLGIGKEVGDDALKEVQGIPSRQEKLCSAKGGDREAIPLGHEALGAPPVDRCPHQAERRVFKLGTDKAG